jgi:phytoene dehydrogenase-like protein
MKYDVVVVGAGMAGLTSAAYLLRAGRSVLICEQAERTGGLVNSFSRDGIHFDAGIRAIENSGIVLPMLRQLGIELDWIRSPVTIGIAERQVRLEDKSSLAAYRDLLAGIFPESLPDIDRIIAAIERVMSWTDLFYGIDNPLFRDLKADREYLLRTVLPWLLQYQLKSGRALRLVEPVYAYLGRLTRNPSLIDLIAQHFFQGTPAFFALSYFGLYLDYRYPRGGMSKLAEAMESWIRGRNGEIRLNTPVTGIDLAGHTIKTAQGETIAFGQLIWAADQKKLYSLLDTERLPDRKTQAAVRQRIGLLRDKRGGDSIFSLFLAVDLEPEYFASRSGPHLFYTPLSRGLHGLGQPALPPAQPETESWLAQYFARTTYEISVPALRDKALAPPGKTGLIVSALMDGQLVRGIRDLGWYEAFKRFCASQIIDVLDSSVFPGLKMRVASFSTATPLTIEQLTGNSDGAITGWAFTNDPIPAEHRFKKIMRSIRTPLPDVYQAGQWSFSPSGLPVSILTGRLAADAADRSLPRR